MSFLDEEILSDEFNALSREEKSARSKDLFGEVLKQSPEMSKQFVEADEQGQQAMLNNFRGALVDKYPDQFSTKRTVKGTETVTDPRPLRFPELPEAGREGDIPEGMEEIGGGIFSKEVDKEVAVPIVDTLTERIASRVDAGDFNPLDALPEDIDLKDISDEDIQKYAELTVFMKQLGNANLISKDKAEAFIDKGEEILQAKGARPEFMSKMTAFAEEQLKLGDFRDLIRTIGEPVAKLEGKLEGKSDEEIEALLQEQREGSDPFGDLEMAVRGEGIQQAKTLGAVGFALASGMAGASAIQKLPTSALNKLGLTAGLEGAIGVSVGDQLPSFSAEMFGVDPDSIEGKALNALEGAFIGTIGALLPKATIVELKKNWREVFGSLKRADNAEDLAADAKIIAEKFGVSEDDAFKVAEEIFTQKPVSRRDVVDPELSREVQSPEAADKLRERLQLEESGGKSVLIDKDVLDQEPIKRRDLVDPELSKDVQSPEAAEKLKERLKAEELESAKEVISEADILAISKRFNVSEDKALEIAEGIFGQKPIERREVVNPGLKGEAQSALGAKFLKERLIAEEKALNPPLIKEEEAAKDIYSNISPLELESISTPLEREILRSKLPQGSKVLQPQLPTNMQEDLIGRRVQLIDALGDDLVPLPDESMIGVRQPVMGLDELLKSKKDIPDEINEAYKNQSTPLQVETERRLKRQDELEEVFGGEPAAPRQTDVDPDVTLAESNMAQKVETDDGFKLPKKQNEIYNKDIDEPGNPNTAGLRDDAPKVEPADPAEQTKLTGESPVDPSSLASDAAREANERIIKRLGKGLLGDEPGKRKGLLADKGLMTDLGVMGADLLSRGFNKFGSWAKEMVRMYGDSIRGMLADVFESSKRLLIKPKTLEVNSKNAFDESIGITKGTNLDASRQFSKNKLVKGIDALTSPISTRIKRISKPIFGRLQKFEFDVLKDTQQSLANVEKFVTGMDTLRKRDRALFRDVDRAFMNGNIDFAKESILKSNMEEGLKRQIVEGIDETRTELDAIRNEAIDQGMDVGHIDNYMPRMVTDHEGMMNSLGLEVRDAISKLIVQEEKRVGYNLNSAQRAELANRYLLRGAIKGEGRLANQKGRTVEEVSEDLQQFYGETHQNLIGYITQFKDRINKQKLFGRSQPVKVGKNEEVIRVPLEDGGYVTDVRNTPPQMVKYDEDSLGALIDEMSPGLGNKDRQELIDLIQSRFVNGDGQAADWIQNLRNLGYIGTMGKFANAITQIGDLWASIRRNPKEFLAGMKDSSPFASEDAVDTIDLGITRMLEEHASNPLATARALDKIFSLSGLKKIDKFGKEVFLNSSLRNFRNTARGKKGAKALEKLRKDHAEVFGDEFADKLIDDLKAGVRSYETDAAVFNALTEVQPITKLEMPEVYLNNPNGRIFYMLKTYGLKQMDIVRREGFDELLDAMQLAKTDKKAAAKKSSNAMMKIGLVALGGPLFEATTSDVLKDTIRGKPVDAESINDAATANFLRFFFVNKHLLRRFGSKRGGFIKAWVEGLLPPIVSLGDQVTHDMVKALEGDLTVDTAQSTYMIPFVGDNVWWNSKAGQERIEELKLERETSNDELFQGIDELMEQSKQDRKANKEDLAADVDRMNNMANQKDRLRYIQSVGLNNPTRAKQLAKEFRRQRLIQETNMTPAEIEFRKKPVDVRANRIAQIINRLPTRREKLRFIADMKRKKILTQPVRAKLLPQIRIND